MRSRCAPPQKDAFGQYACLRPAGGIVYRFSQHPGLLLRATWPSGNLSIAFGCMAGSDAVGVEQFVHVSVQVAALIMRMPQSKWH
jgi:hypothetical protein